MATDLTPDQRAALLWLPGNCSGKHNPDGLHEDALCELCERGLTRKEWIGRVGEWEPRWAITPAGQRVRKELEHGN